MPIHRTDRNVLSSGNKTSSTNLVLHIQSNKTLLSSIPYIRIVTTKTDQVILFDIHIQWKNIAFSTMIQFNTYSNQLSCCILTDTSATTVKLLLLGPESTAMSVTTLTSVQDVTPNTNSHQGVFWLCYSILKCDG